MDQFYQKEMKKVMPFKNTCYDWLINYIPEPIRKSVGGFKDKVISCFKKNTPKQTVYGRGRKLSKPNTKQNQKSFYNKKEKKKEIKERIIRDTLSLFETEEEKKEIKELEKKKIDDRLIKDRIIRDIRTLFEQQEEKDCCKP